MLNFVKSMYRVFVEICLWTILILCSVIGGVIGSDGRNAVGDDYTFVGVCIGFVVGILTDVIVGGIIATFLAIEENTAKTKENTEQMIFILKNTAKSAAVPNSPVADEHGRTDYRTWWDSDGGKHESWVDADGNKHET